MFDRNLHVYAGVGANVRFNNDEAAALAAKGASFEYLWDGAKVSAAGRAGAGLDIRLTDAVKLNLEAGVNALSGKWNIQASEVAKLDEIASFMAENRVTICFVK